MWIGYLPIYPKHLEIVINYHKDTQIGGLKLWNYNKSIIDSTKGLKEIKISINDNQVWEGIVKSGRA